MTKKRAPKRRAAASASRPIAWSDRALSDLDEIGDFIAQDDPLAADQWVMNLIGVAEKAARIPQAGRRVPELARDDVREMFLRTYRVVYRLTVDRVEILTIFEGHHLFPDDVTVPRSGG